MTGYERRALSDNQMESGPDTMEIGFIGLGAMGLAMAQRLVAAGHRLAVYNRTAAKAEPLRAAGATVVAAPSKLVDREVIISMLADDAAVREVFLAGGRLALPFRADAIHLSMSTISPALAQELAELHRAQGSHLVAAPVLGRPNRAAQGELFVLAAGPAAALERCQPVLAALGQRTFTLGSEPPLALTVKIAINFMLAAAIESMSESFALVRKAGVDVDQFRDIVTGTIFSAPVYTVYAPMIAHEICEKADFTLSLGLKDVQLAIDASRRLQAPLPLAGLLQSQLIAAMARGYSEFDWAALGRLAARNAGLPEGAASETR